MYFINTRSILECLIPQMRNSNGRIYNWTVQTTAIRVKVGVKKRIVQYRVGKAIRHGILRSLCVANRGIVLRVER